MVPDSVAGEALGLLLTEYLIVPAELLWYFVEIGFFCSFCASVGIYCCVSYVVLMRWLRPGDIVCSWDKLSALSILGVQNNWQLCVVDPPLFPVNSGLYCRKP
jgi:hypothetical protein